MINWDELKHMHVIRKLEHVLGQWFQTELFFLDDRGQIKNLDFVGRSKEFKNPVARALLSKEQGIDWFMRFAADASERACNSAESRLWIEGPLGIDRVFVSRISSGNDYLGCVFAYCYFENGPDAAAVKKAREQLSQHGLDPSILDQALANQKPIAEGDRRYFFELVDLVAQEVVTYHTEIAKREERISALNSQLGVRYSYDSMVGKSKPMQDLYSLLDKIKASEATVLVQGENGTGKELIARSVHFNSPRKEAPFVAVNCAAFTETLLDSELFGHVRGAFTGAVKDKKGVFEAAHRGTLFLDEIGDMTLSMQVKLLRILQQGTFIPVGSTDEKKVDVRVIAATNRDLKDMVARGTFREDLYYRINVINIAVPSLRDRKEDIPLLLDAFIDRVCKEKGVATKPPAKRLIEKMFDYSWPGNIRELENEVERLIVLSGDEPRVSADHLSAHIRDFSGAGSQGKMQGLKLTGKLNDAIEELEKTMIREGLRRTKWNKTKLAKELGISRASLIAKVQKYELDKRKILGGPSGGRDAA